MAEGAKDLTAIGLEILQTARNELYLNLPYLDAALCSLDFQPGGGMTLSLATDGETLYYDGSFLAERYLRSRTAVDRVYLHVILHCMLRHLWKKRGKAAELWDLACDAAVESILDTLDYPCLNGGTVPAKEKFYGECRGEMPVLTAEGIYRHLLRQDLPPYELARLQRVFLADDHGLWDPEGQDQERQRQREQKWQAVSEKTQTGLETVLSGTATGGEAVLEQIRVANRDDVDYRAFLRRFAVPREVMAVDGDAFDYVYYTYGLQLYGNMPLVEPPEDQGGEADRGLRHRCGHLHVHLRRPGAGVPGLHLRHPPQHGDLHPEGEHPHPPVRRPAPVRHPHSGSGGAAGIYGELLPGGRQRHGLPAGLRLCGEAPGGGGFHVSAGAGVLH